jgi:hypothetical protein
MERDTPREDGPRRLYASPEVLAELRRRLDGDAPGPAPGRFRVTLRPLPPRPDDR